MRLHEACLWLETDGRNCRLSLGRPPLFDSEAWGTVQLNGVFHLSETKANR